MLTAVTTEFIFHFMLIFARIGTAFSRFPAIGAPYIFPRAKVAFSLSVSFIMMPLLQPYLPPYSPSVTVSAAYLLTEVLIGLIISLASSIYFQCLHLVGQVISMQSGLGSAMFFDPLHKGQVAIFSNLLILATIVCIFATDTHHLFFQTIMDSYHTFPPGISIDSGDLGKFVTTTINDSFILSFQLSAPFFIISMAIITGTGVLSRLMPSLQVFFIITPAQILIMFITLYIALESIIMKLVYVIANISTNSF